jgi:hypothetical protein
MRNPYYVVTLIAAGLITAAAAEDAEKWRMEKDKNGIQVYTRAVDGWSIREIRGVTVVPAPLPSVVAVINDVSALPRLTDVVSKAVVRNRESDTRYEVYSVISMPWPVSDRDILNRREIKQDPDSLTVTITDVATHDAMPPQKGVVHIVNSRQTWTLTPRADGSVAAEMRTLSEPAGPIPAAVINALSVSMPFKTLTQLREMVKHDPYTHAQLSFIKSGAEPVLPKQ